MDSSTKRMYKLGQGTYKVILSFPDIGQSGITYETDALEYDKFSLTESLMNGDSLEFVGCISNILQAQIHGANANLEGEKVIASIDIDGQDDPLQIFVGYVKSSKTRSDLAYKEIVCYDLEALQNGRIQKFHHYGLWGKGFRARLRRGWFLLWHPQRD